MRPLGAALLLSAAVLVMGCQSKTASLDSTDPLTTASTGEPSLKRTAELGERWRANPKDVKLGLAYADGLGQLGQTDQQAQVYQQLAQVSPGDPAVASIYGKKLLEMGRASDAIGVLEPLANSGKADWKLLSALGSAYDQDGQHGAAREQYQKALAAKPNDISVMNNMGMSYALEGNLPAAEKVLREAVTRPDSSKFPKVRQNLALVVGLQGRFDESRQIASTDLPPEDVDANLAYLQKMLSQPNTWKQLSSGNPG